MFGSKEAKKILRILQCFVAFCMDPDLHGGKVEGLKYSYSMKGHMDPDLWLESLVRGPYIKYFLFYVFSNT